MNPRRFLLFVILVCTFMVFYAEHGSNAQQSPNPTAPQMQKDAPYHPGGEYQTGSDGDKQSPRGAGGRSQRLSASPLAKIEILPAAIAISGSHYNQRLVVEGTLRGRPPGRLDGSGGHRILEPQGGADQQ